MRQETEEFIDHVVWKERGPSRALDCALHVRERHARDFLRHTGGHRGRFHQGERRCQRAPGLLTQASILALTTPGSRTDPVVRGKWVYTNILCGTVPDPPPNVPPLAEPAPGITTRQRFEKHRNRRRLQGCHNMMDPIGFGFEHYDGIGLWRDTEDGLTIDDSGNIPNTDAPGDFKGARRARAASSPRAATRRTASRGTGCRTRTDAPRSTQDACTRASLQEAFAASGGNIKKLMVALTQTDAFLYGPSAAGPGLERRPP